MSGGVTVHENENEFAAERSGRREAAELGRRLDRFRAEARASCSRRRQRSRQQVGGREKGQLTKGGVQNIGANRMRDRIGLVVVLRLQPNGHHFVIGRRAMKSRELGKRLGERGVLGVVAGTVVPDGVAVAGQPDVELERADAVIDELVEQGLVALIRVVGVFLHQHVVTNWAAAGRNQAENQQFAHVAA